MLLLSYHLNSNLKHISHYPMSDLDAGKKWGCQGSWRERNNEDLKPPI